MEHVHKFIIEVEDVQSAGVNGVCECGESRYFRMTSKKQAMKEFRERGIEPPPQNKPSISSRNT